MLSDLISINKKLYTYWDEPVSQNHPIFSVLGDYKTIHPDYEIGLINIDEIKHFLYKNFTFLYDFFDIFKIYTIRSDISRMAHLYLHGGFYCDSHIQIIDKLEKVQICESSGNRYNSYITTFECGTHLTNVSLQYSIGYDPIQMKCLEIVQSRLKAIIDSKKTKANQYAHDIHVACSNGMYSYLDINGNNLDPNTNKSYLFNHFGHIRPYGGNPHIFKPYESIIMTSPLSRANNKHWSILCKEIDLI